MGQAPACGRTFQLLKDTSRQTGVFAKATGLHCKTGCGKCCENPEVETTVTEAMPLAAHLWEKGRAEEILEIIEARSAKGVCVFYRPDPLVPGNGRCAVYEQRPGICRLFGFSAKKDKHGRPVLVTCTVIKEKFPNDYHRACDHIAKGQPVPILSDHTIRVFSLDPSAGMQLLPINAAVRMALERVGIGPGRSHFA